MIKHILTLDCPRACAYCITRNVPACDPRPDLLDPSYKAQAALGETSLMLTGGEPTLDYDFLATCLEAGRRHFDEVHLTTQSRRFLDSFLAKFFDSITYSHHDRDPDDLPFVGPTVRTHLSVIDEQYLPILPILAKASGFRGMTINEEQRAGDRFDETQLPDLRPGFTFKINRRGHCMGDKILLPDFTLTTDFTPLL